MFQSRSYLKQLKHSAARRKHDRNNGGVCLEGFPLTAKECRPAMTPKQISLVQESFRSIAPIKEAAGSLFYERLFTLNPSLKKLFRRDMGDQSRELLNMIGQVVDGLNKPDEVLPVARHLGARHAGYGVEPEHYNTVGEALLWTLALILGDDFDAETKEAWIAAYGVLSAAMQESSDSVSA